MQVVWLLSNLVTGTDADPWIQPYIRSQNGREAFLALRDYYEEGGNEHNLITRAEQVLKDIHYSNEQAFSFESYSSALLKAYRDLDGTECEKTEYEKVWHLLKTIKVQHSEVEIHKNHVPRNF